MPDIFSDEVYFVLSFLTLGWFLYYAVYQGIIRKEISIKGVRKTGIAARNWGIFLTLTGIIFIVLFLYINYGKLLK